MVSKLGLILPYKHTVTRAKSIINTAIFDYDVMMVPPWINVFVRPQEAPLHRLNCVDFTTDNFLGCPPHNSRIQSSFLDH